MYIVRHFSTCMTTSITDFRMAAGYINEMIFKSINISLRCWTIVESIDKIETKKVDTKSLWGVVNSLLDIN